MVLMMVGSRELRLRGDGTMSISPEVINGYLEWRRDKELYPPLWSAEEYVEDLLKSDARDKLNIIYALFEDEDENILEQIREVLF
jgi:hypothetical protein